MIKKVFNLLISSEEKITLSILLYMPKKSFMHMCMTSQTYIHFI